MGDSSFRGISHIFNRVQRAAPLQVAVALLDFFRQSASAVLCCMIVALLFIFSAAVPASAQEPDLVALVNQARANAGIAPLRSDAQLVTASQRHSNDMAARDVLSHTGGDGSSVGTRVTQAGYSWNAVGENVLYRWDVNAQGAFDQWWNSTGHRNNMMNATYCDIGVTRARAASGRIYYTMVLARRSGTSSCPTQTPTPAPPTPTPTATPVPTAFLTGTLTLQGRGSASILVLLQITSGGQTTTYSPTTNGTGAFTLSGLALGSVTVRIKHQQSLAVVRAMTLAGGNNNMNFGTLLTGDTNNDNTVTLQDFSILAASFNRSSGQAGYDARPDLNGDGAVTLQDFSLLAANFNQVGQ
jgi:hypothetical protein